VTAEAIKPVKISVPLSAVDESIRERVGEGSPRPLRLAMAKGALPIDPGKLLVAFSYLAQDPDEEIAAAAHASAADLPEQFVRTTLQSRNTAAEVLGYYCRYFVHDNRYIETLLVNSETPDDAFVYMANELREAKWLDMVSFNQVRYLRTPEIIEAAFYNPDTKMSAVSRMLETAARNGLELGHIPGFREIQATILGEAELKRRRDAGEISSSEFDELMEVETEDSGMDDDQFQELLREATEELDESLAGKQSEEEGEEEKVPLWKAISTMKTSQKARLAILGSASARKILIRDPKKSVCMAVLRSPRLTDKEVSFFASQKGLSEDVIRFIAKNREWTRHYSTKVSLVKNPKTPPQQSMWFLKSLHPKDLKHISKDRDVPGIVAKTAKRMIEQKNSARRG
jgi:hypothetical protein